MAAVSASPPPPHPTPGPGLELSRLPLGPQQGADPQQARELLLLSLTSGALMERLAPVPTCAATLQSEDCQLRSHQGQSMPRSGLSFESHAPRFFLVCLFPSTAPAIPAALWTFRAVGQLLALISLPCQPLCPPCGALLCSSIGSLGAPVTPHLQEPRNCCVGAERVLVTDIY